MNRGTWYDLDDAKILVIDDISDKGETLLKLYRDYPAWKTATLQVKPHTAKVPTYYAEMVPNDTWIVYPWEKNEHETS